MIDACASWLASVAMRLAIAIMPARHRAWGRAMQSELFGLQGFAALRFACGCVGAALRMAAETFTAPSTSPDVYVSHPHPRVRTIALVCAVAATLLGLVYLALAGAPSSLLAVNAMAFLIGLAILSALAALPPRGNLAGVASIALGVGLLATSLFGLRVEGASRWLSLGGIVVQPSLLVIPVMAIGMARHGTWPFGAGVMLAAVAMALQPDRAMAGALAAGLSVAALVRRDGVTVAALVVAAGGFAWTLAQPDTLPAMPYVDQIIYTAYTSHPLAGLAVHAGLLVMLVPAIYGLCADRPNRDVHLAFGAVWLTIITAAALGNYPTPLVGYGGSAIIGYLLSLLALPAHAQSSGVAASSVRSLSSNGEPMAREQAA